MDDYSRLPPMFTPASTTASRPTRADSFSTDPYAGYGDPLALEDLINCGADQTSPYESSEDGNGQEEPEEISIFNDHFFNHGTTDEDSALETKRILELLGDVDPSSAEDPSQTQTSHHQDLCSTFRPSLPSPVLSHNDQDGAKSPEDIVRDMLMGMESFKSLSPSAMKQTIDEMFSIDYGASSAIPSGSQSSEIPTFADDADGLFSSLYEGIGSQATYITPALSDVSSLQGSITPASSYASSLQRPTFLGTKRSLASDTFELPKRQMVDGQWLPERARKLDRSLGITPATVNPTTAGLTNASSLQGATSSRSKRRRSFNKPHLPEERPDDKYWTRERAKELDDALGIESASRMGDSNRGDNRF